MEQLNNDVDTRENHDVDLAAAPVAPSHEECSDTEETSIQDKIPWELKVW